MKIAGIIAEYNPFHEGHRYHILETRARTGCDYVICVMDGAFTQRGEPAMLDKFSRAECALLSGADAVFELPSVFAVRPAEIFARGGVGILDALGADYISFGCETDDMALLQSLSDALLRESDALKAEIRAGLDEGKTLARARGEALSKLTGADGALIGQPNVTLALEYLKSMSLISSRMRAVAVKRTAPYHGGGNGFESASSVRALIYAGQADRAISSLPENTRPILEKARNGGFSNPAALDNLALSVLRRMSISEAEALPDAGEGLAGRLIACAREAHGYESLISAVKCKRYTRARITRVIAAAMIGLDAEAPDRIPYLRLLGFRKDAEPLLRELSARSSLPIASDPARLEGDPAFETEKRVTDLWGLTANDPELRVCGRDRTRKFLVVSK